MKAYCNQLPRILSKGLQAFYLITGEEPLQKMEAVDAIIAAARKQGYCDRELSFADKDFDWNSFKLGSDNMSLFDDKRLFDVRIQTEKPNEKAVDFIKSLLDTLPSQEPEGCIYIFQVRKVDGRAAWIKKAASVGVWVPVYPKSAADMPAWVRERILRHRLTVEQGVVDLIAEYTEGNMLAAAQEIDKIRLAMSNAEDTVTVDAAQKIMSNSAHYTAWDFSDAVMAGNAERAFRILHGLRSEAVAIPLILSVVAGQCRELAKMSEQIETGSSLDDVLRSVWRKRQAAYRNALMRCSRAQWWNVMLHGCYQVDRSVKGYGVDEDWNELLRLTMRILQMSPLKKPVRAAA